MLRQGSQRDPMKGKAFLSFASFLASTLTRTAPQPSICLNKCLPCKGQGIDVYLESSSSIIENIWGVSSEVPWTFFKNMDSKHLEARPLALGHKWLMRDPWAFIFVQPIPRCLRGHGCQTIVLGKNSRPKAKPRLMILFLFELLRCSVFTLPRSSINSDLTSSQLKLDFHPVGTQGPLLLVLWDPTSGSSDLASCIGVTV